MDDNPYRSPNATQAEPDRDRRLGRGPIAMAWFGLLLGGFIGAGAGAIGAGGLGVVVGVSSGEVDAVIGFGVAGSVMGTFLGAVAGSGVGLISGVTSALSRDTFRHRLVYLAAGLSAVCGGLVGVLGGALFSHGPLGATPLWILVGASCGLAAGIGGGVALGRAIGRLAWGPPPPIAPNLPGANPPF